MPLQPGIAKLWSAHQHLFADPLPIAAAVGIWVVDHGLSIADADRILRVMMAPSNMATYHFHADLMTTLAALAEQAIRRSAEAQRERAEREYARQRDGGPRDPNAVRSAIGDLMRRWGA